MATLWRVARYANTTPWGLYGLTVAPNDDRWAAWAYMMEYAYRMAEHDTAKRRERERRNGRKVIPASHTGNPLIDADDDELLELLAEEDDDSDVSLTGADAADHWADLDDDWRAIEGDAVNAGPRDWEPVDDDGQPDDWEGPDA